MKGINGPAAMKAALTDLLDQPAWPVRPPLEPLTPAVRDSLITALGDILAEGAALNNKHTTT
jgi:hypothetical protein